MKRIILLLTTLNLLFICLSAQDIITQSNGDRITCKISKIDSANVYFIVKQRGKMLDTFLPKSRIQNIEYVTILPYASTSDSIIIRKKSIFHQGQLITPSMVVQLLKSNNEAYRKYSGSKTPAAFAYVLSYAGGLLIGYPVGTAIAGGDPNWTSAAIGAGLILFAIPIEVIAVKNQREAINIYNTGVRSKEPAKMEGRIGITSYGLTFCLKF
jgi:hypothetical protein